MKTSSHSRVLARNHPGRKIRKAREALGMSRLALAYKADLNLRTVERIENGEVENPRSSTMTVIEMALGMEGARA